MPIDKKLLEILVCPVTKQPVFMLSEDNLKKLNQLITEGKVETVAGNQVTQPISEALITKNESTIYRIEEGIPIMLEDQGIAGSTMEQFL